MSQVDTVHNLLLLSGSGILLYMRVVLMVLGAFILLAIVNKFLGGNPFG
ncbi:hypothetical protein KC887_04045 [Candidatus Kaiserbacteria bacterium]|nr:hypothetical protein [Candidatus Kaiserbacteria bacterium]